MTEHIRKSNFELVRIIKMYVLDHSEVFNSRNFMSFNFIISNISNGLSVVAVNCYILINGYFECK